MLLAFHDSELLIFMLGVFFIGLWLYFYRSMVVFLKVVVHYVHGGNLLAQLILAGPYDHHLQQRRLVPLTWGILGAPNLHSHTQAGPNRDTLSLNHDTEFPLWRNYQFPP